MSGLGPTTVESCVFSEKSTIFLIVAYSRAKVNSNKASLKPLKSLIILNMVNNIVAISEIFKHHFNLKTPKIVEIVIISQLSTVVGWSPDSASEWSCGF